MSEIRLDDTAVVIERQYAAPIERVWRAWTDPAEFAAWAWGSLGNCVVATLDVRPGGTYRVVTNRPDGGAWSFRGRYEDVVAPRQLVFSVEWDAPMGYTAPPERVVVALEARGAETAMIFIHEGVPTAEAREGHRKGWEDCVTHLARRLADGAPPSG